MAENSDVRRVLVIDDSGEMRTVIRRALAAGGYHVDDVATLAEARALDPYAYQGILIDVRLGPEQGSDFLREMVTAVPDMAGRCLAITGGSIDAIPEGISYLTKPFRPDQLLAAVETLTHAGHGDGRPAARSRPPAAGRPAPETEAGPGQAANMLDFARLVRMRERRHLADRLHDGPVQELCAAALGLHLMRRRQQADQADLLALTIGQIDQATAAVRSLMQEWEQDGLPHVDARLDAAVRDRIAWLVVSPAVVDTDPPEPELPAGQVLLIADVAELMVCLLAGDGPLPSARLSVQVARDSIRIDVDATAPGGSDIAQRQPADPAGVQTRLRDLAASLAATQRVSRDQDRVRASLTLPLTPGRPGREP